MKTKYFYKGYKLITILLLVIFPGFLSAQKNSNPVYKDKNASIEERIDDLVNRMTLEEKIQQMNQSTFGRNTNPNNIEKRKSDVNPNIGSLLYRSTTPVYRNMIQQKAMEESRLGIPIIFGFDDIHGFRTIFPIPLAQSCSWNTELVREASAVSAKEARMAGVDWSFSPMLDVARDPRWGRVAESYGEDPYVNARFGVATVEGYQGDDLSDPYTIAACLKHYVGYSQTEGGRDYRYSDVSAQTLWETFLVPFEAGIKAGAATVMSGFNDISGIPASANHYTLTEILKDKWGHEGFVVSDWESIENLVRQGYAKDRKEAGLRGFSAGVEMDMVDGIYVEHLPRLLEEGKISMKQIDEAVSRILRVKFQLGLFDEPYVEEIDEKERFLHQSSLELAHQLASETMVLLKNEKQVLPIAGNIRSMALIGPMAKDSVNILGSWAEHGRPEEVKTLYDGILEEFGTLASVIFAEGCDFEGDDVSGYDEALEAAMQADIILLCLGEKRRWSGENASRASIALPEIQESLAKKLSETGKPIILILSSGRPVEMIRLEPYADAIIEIWQPGIEGGGALAEILSGKINPSGKLSITFPWNVGQVPISYNMRKPARPTLGEYLDIPGEPFYTFGHGLSYTSYEYREVHLSKESFDKTEKIIAEVDVTNTGAMTGKETVLWFISDPYASITRPNKELKYFEKKEIQPGETISYRFEIDPARDLSFPDAHGEKHLEPGEFYLMVNDQKVVFELTD